MNRLSLAMRVTSWSLVVPRLIVQFSRNVLRSPISRRVGSPSYFRSCGAAPIEANWKMRLSRPMRGRPFDHDVRPDPGAGADRRRPAPMTVYGADLDVRRELARRAAIERGGMDRPCSGQLRLRSGRDHHLGAASPPRRPLRRRSRTSRCRASSARASPSGSAGRPAPPAGGSAPCRCRRSRTRASRPGTRRRSRTRGCPPPAPAPRGSSRPASPAGAGNGPGKNGSLTVTFLSARMRLPGTHSSTRSTSRKG